jgi:hypothetical protein
MQKSCDPSVAIPVRLAMKSMMAATLETVVRTYMMMREMMSMWMCVCVYQLNGGILFVTIHAFSPCCVLSCHGRDIHSKVRSVDVYGDGVSVVCLIVHQSRQKLDFAITSVSLDEAVVTLMTCVALQGWRLNDVAMIDSATIMLLSVSSCRHDYRFHVDRPSRAGLCC